MFHVTKDGIGIAARSWLWVWVELLAWYLSRLEHLNGIEWLWVQNPLRPTFYSYFKDFVIDENHMNQLIPLHSCDYVQKTLIKINVATKEGKQPKWNVTLNKRLHWSSCSKLALSVSWTLGRIAQSVIASVCKSVVVGLNPTQGNFQ